MAISDACCQGFSLDTLVSSPPSLVSSKFLATSVALCISVWLPSVALHTSKFLLISYTHQ